MSKSKHIAIFGGSFNPPHWAHHQVLEYLAGLEEFDEVWMVPAFDHPFEKDLLPYDVRKRFCEATVYGLGALVSGIEGELGLKPTYTIDVVRALKKKFPGDRFSIVVGSDCKKDLDHWKDVEILKQEASFYFVPRPGFESSPFQNISSTQLRNWIKEGRPVSKYLVPEVARLIEKEGFYR